MKVTIQYFDGCPHWKLADERVRRVLKGAATDEVTLEYELIDSPEKAERIGFHGSPTILVDGVDPFVTGDEPIGLTCRVFRTEAGAEGAPTEAEIREVLHQSPATSFEPSLGPGNDDHPAYMDRDTTLMQKTGLAAQVQALGQARLAQGITVSWMLLEGVIAVGAGLVAHSVALSAFGFDSFIELFSAAVVLRRVFERSATEERGSRTVGERTASRLVGFALYLLIAYIVVSAGAGLLLRLRPEPSPVGIGLTVLSIAIMTVLWRWRLSLAERLGSPALRGDAACSVVCLYLGIATLAGLALNALMGWWWADPIAGVALIWWIRGEASEALEAATPQPTGAPT